MRYYQPRQDAFVETETGVQPRPCDHAGCVAEGLYRAPRSRHDPASHFWFCLDHVRAYNEAWDFCAGMNGDDIERMIRADTIWQRPTWPLGRNGLAAEHALHDPFDLDLKPKGKAERPAPALAPPVRRALALFGLEPPLEKAHLKRRYKELVKLHHPDANPGDEAAAERFKAIAAAYKILLDSLIK
jgi:hypothetical protein